VTNTVALIGAIRKLRRKLIVMNTAPVLNLSVPVLDMNLGTKDDGSSDLPLPSLLMILAIEI
jgi:hypothetical protein